MPRKKDPLKQIEEVVNTLTKQSIKRQKKLTQDKEAKPKKTKKAQDVVYVDATRNQRGRTFRRNLSNIDIQPPQRGKDYEDGKQSLLQFIEIYLKHMFPLPFSDDHITALDRIEESIKEGGLFATAASRGDGKTSRTIASILWCILYGHKKFMVIIASDADAAKSILSEVLHELADNEKIGRDWNHIQTVIRSYIESPNSLRHMIVNNENPRCDIKTNKIVMPTIKGIEDACNGTIVVAKGLTASLRGIRHKLQSGETVRPDYAIIDDPSSDESAASPIQNDMRERLLTGAILGMAGPNKKISAVCSCTVIQPNDLAARLLDHDRHPEWQGHKAKLVYEWSKEKELWEQYAQLRKEDQTDSDARYTKSTEFYKQNREKMDKDVVIGWEHRYREGELSAIQHAYNLLIDRGQLVFDCEYQNEPKNVSTSSYDLDEKLILSRLSGFNKHTAPVNCEYIVTGVDINYCGLNWVTIAARKDSSSFVVDWGKYPEGVDLIPKKTKEAPEQTISQAIYKLVREQEEKVVMVGNQARRIGLIVIDCGNWTDCVINTISAIKSHINIMAIRGRDAKTYKTKRDAIRSGNEWQINRWERLNSPVLIINADYYREAMQRGFLITPGSPSSISLYGNDHMAHIRLAKEISSERLSEKVITQTSTFYRWEQTPGIAHDLGDAMTYAFAAIHAAGASPISLPKMPEPLKEQRLNRPETVNNNVVHEVRRQPQRRPRSPIVEY